jgi:hypothetical protein
VPGAVRETTITLYGARRTVRTKQGRRSLAALERAHTAAVLAALNDLHSADVEREYAAAMADIDSRAWPDSDGWPGSGERHRDDALRRAAQWRAKRLTRTWHRPRDGVPAARRPWRPPAPLAAIPASLRDLHEPLTRPTT